MAGPPQHSASTSSKGPENLKVPNHRSRRRERRRAAKEAQEQDATPVASGSSTPYNNAADDGHEARKDGNANANGAHISKDDGTRTFAEGDDFIPFTFSDPSDGEDAGPSTSRVKSDRQEKAEKESDHEVAADRAEDGKRGDGPSSMSERAKEKSKVQDSPPRHREPERSRRSGRDERDDDHNGRGSDRKRKHDDYEDGYANKKERVDAASRKSPWISNVDLAKCHNVAEMMHKEVESFVDWISPTPVEDEIRGLIVSQISKIVVTTFPDAVVYPFGSYQTKLYLPLGDIDLVILSDSMAYSDKSTVLYALANTLKRNGITSHVTIIAKAKVPIVKFVTTHGRFKVDISINQANGLVSGNIISGFLRDMIPSKGGESKALRSLVMVTKAFLSQRSMNEVYTGGLGSYAIVCLAVSFLQMHPKIRRGEIDPEQNLGVLVMEFFELYGNHFNYDEVGISLRDGGTYFNKRQRGWYAEYKRNMLSIEDPADPSNDISSGSYNFHKVRTAFAGCHGILSSTAYLRAGILSSRQHGRSVHLRSHYEPEDMSILSTVMGITQETLNHRRMVQELYDKQVLHRIVGIPPLAPPEKKSRASTSKGDSSSSSKSRASKVAVESVWNDHRDDPENHADEHDFRRRPENQSFDEEGGRYDIGRQPPKKRRKTGRSEDAHAVYFEEDDDTEEPIHGMEDVETDSSDSDVKVLRVTSTKEKESPSVPKDTEKTSGRRAYWLAKSAGIEGGVLDEDGSI